MTKCDTTLPDSLVYCEDTSYLQSAIKNSSVSVIITTPKLLAEHANPVGKGIVVSQHPRVDYWTLHNRMHRDRLILPQMEFGMGTGCKIHPSAIVSQKTMIGDHVDIGANAVIEDYSIILDNACIGPGAVIGAEGLQTFDMDGQKVPVRHAGGAKIGPGVCVLANAVVSKAVRPSFTEIGDGTQISLLSSVGHECKIGRNCSVAGNVIVGGSVEIGDAVRIGPGVTIKDSVRIGSDANIRLGSVVIKDVGSGESVSGNFALMHDKNLMNYLRNAR